MLMLVLVLVLVFVLVSVLVLVWEWDWWAFTAGFVLRFNESAPHAVVCLTCDQIPLHRKPNTVRNWRPQESISVITRSVAISAQTIVTLSTATMKQRATIVYTTSSSQCISRKVSPDCLQSSLCRITGKRHNMIKLVYKTLEVSESSSSFLFAFGCRRDPGP